MMLGKLVRCLAPALCAALLVSCALGAEVPASATPQATAEGDAVATQVAIAQAVAATLTASVPLDTPPTPETSDADQTPTAITADTPLPENPTEAPLAPSEPPPAPTDTPTEIPEETLPRAYAPNGNADNLLGGIVVPDEARIVSYSEGNDLEVAFQSGVWFRVLAYVPSGDGNDRDGAGIQEVRFSITGPTTSGESGVIHEQTEMNAAYCVFGGGEPDCNVWDFSANNNAWPNGEPVQFGENYHVQVNIDGADGDAGASWNFNFTIEAPE